MSPKLPHVKNFETRGGASANMKIS